MRQSQSLLYLLVLLQQLAISCHGFVEFPRLTSWRPTLQTVFSTKQKPYGTKSSYQQNAGTDDIVEMRADIERMREEAALRLDALNEKLIVASQQTTTHNHNKETVLVTETTATNSEQEAVDRVHRDDAKTMENLSEIADAFERDMTTLDYNHDEPKTHSPSAAVTATTAAVAAKVTQQRPTDIRHPLKLLDDTRWRIMLNAGRVPGTWMPKSWGASGDHLRMKLEVEFTTEELYEREDFFNGLSDGAKVLRVVHNEGSMSPTMNEGGKTIRVVDGGWRVCPHEGPLGTAILRWYFDVEEEARHLGSDVYLPKGRVYGTCGYFPMIGRSNVDGRGTSKREIYQQEIRQMEVQYLSLQAEMDRDPDFVSLDKWKRFQEMREVRREAKIIKRAIDEEFIKEPTKSSLRMSRDQSVGLTHEGGMCCKKQNGLAQEYHILGKFEVASIENREHSDYRDLLRP